MTDFAEIRRIAERHLAAHAWTPPCQCVACELARVVLALVGEGGVVEAAQRLVVSGVPIAYEREDDSVGHCAYCHGFNGTEHYPYCAWQAFSNAWDAALARAKEAAK